MSGHGVFIQATSKIPTVIFGKLFITPQLAKGRFTPYALSITVNYPDLPFAIRSRKFGLSPSGMSDYLSRSSIKYPYVLAVSVEGEYLS